MPASGLILVKRRFRFKGASCGKAIIDICNVGVTLQGLCEAEWESITNRRVCERRRMTAWQHDRCMSVLELLVCFCSAHTKLKLRTKKYVGTSVKVSLFFKSTLLWCVWVNHMLPYWWVRPDNTWRHYYAFSESSNLLVISTIGFYLIRLPFELEDWTVWRSVEPIHLLIRALWRA